MNATRGVDFPMENSKLLNDKIDIVSVNGTVYTHKQIEVREGRVYMRLKRRNLQKLYGF